MAVFHDEEQNKKLAEIRARQEEAAVKELAETYGIGYVDLSGIGINTDGLLLIPEEASRAAKIACFAMVGKQTGLYQPGGTQPGDFGFADRCKQPPFPETQGLSP